MLRPIRSAHVLARVVVIEKARRHERSKIHEFFRRFRGDIGPSVFEFFALEVCLDAFAPFAAKLK